MNIPSKPLEKSTDAHHKAISSIIQFLGELHQNGSGAKGFTQDQINTMTDKSLAGNRVFNETTGKSNIADINPSTEVITWKEL